MSSFLCLAHYTHDKSNLADSAGCCLFCVKTIVRGQRPVTTVSRRLGQRRATQRRAGEALLSASRASRRRPFQERSRSVYFSCITAGYKWLSQYSVPIQAAMVEGVFHQAQASTHTHTRLMDTHAHAHTHTKTEIK